MKPSFLFILSFLLLSLSCKADALDAFDAIIDWIFWAIVIIIGTFILYKSLKKNSKDRKRKSFYRDPS